MAGFTIDDSNEIVDTLMERFQLSEYKNVKCANLSGGNKRKVCAAISLIGMPKVKLEINIFCKSFF